MQMRITLYTGVPKNVPMLETLYLDCIYVTSQDLVCDLGTFIFVPIFHHYNVNDNIIIMLACFSSVSSRIVRAFAKTELVFFSSTLCGVWMYISSAPIRSNITSKKMAS